MLLDIQAWWGFHKRSSGGSSRKVLAELATYLETKAVQSDHSTTLVH